MSSFGDIRSSANRNRLAQSLVDLPTILMPGSIKSLDHGCSAHVLCACLWFGYVWVGDHGVRNNQRGQDSCIFLLCLIHVTISISYNVEQLVDSTTNAIPDSRQMTYIIERLTSVNYSNIISLITVYQLMFHGKRSIRPLWLKDAFYSPKRFRVPNLEVLCCTAYIGEDSSISGTWICWWYMVGKTEHLYTSSWSEMAVIILPTWNALSFYGSFTLYPTFYVHHQ